MKSQETVSGLLVSIRAALYDQAHLRQSQAARLAADATTPPPFVTVSRQAGAGGRTFARLLVDRLNELDPGPRPWAVWDRELVEKVAAAHQIPPSLIDNLEDHHPSVIEQLFAAFRPGAGGASLDEYQVYRAVAQTVRGLARAGRAVIVGRGGVYATDDLPGGIHVRLVAPLEQRVRHMAALLAVPEARAAAEVHRLDLQRDTFHRRYGSGRALLPEIFTVTLNTAAMEEERLLGCILPLIVTRPAGNEPPAPQLQAVAATD